MVWAKLAEEIGVSEPTVRKWHAAHVGNDPHVHSLTTVMPVTEERFMRYFGLEDRDQLVKLVSIDVSAMDENESSKQLQEIETIATAT